VARKTAAAKAGVTDTWRPKNVSAQALRRLESFVALLIEWQRKTNLIAPSTLPEIWSRHVADSLQLLDLAPDAKTWIDLGSGGGFPGLVIACSLEPPALVHLVESNMKKAAFLREAVRVTGVPAQVHAQRIEDFAKTFQGPVDVVTARALAPMPKLFDLIEPFVKKGAKGLLLKGQDVEAELTESSKYWKVQADLIPSKTDPAGRIVVLRQLERISA
jgi:16S rRNA (guanine527-N7)-methyltransferase